MKVTVILEHRFKKTPDGKYWTSSSFRPEFWKNYLTVFDGVTIYARTERVETQDDFWSRVDGPNIGFIDLPYYIGPRQFVGSVRQQILQASSVSRSKEAILVRTPSTTGNLVTFFANRSARPFGVEVVGDPADSLSRDASSSFLAPVFRHWFSASMKSQCSSATCASYVTSGVLQDKYPPGTSTFRTHYSSIVLGELQLAVAPREPQSERPHRLISVGTLESLYKAPDVMIASLAKLKGFRSDVRLTIVGDGRRRTELERMAEEQGVSEQIGWTGLLAGFEEIRPYLDASDLFLLPSRQEGLPRAMIEAMARGLPCIGSTVGGIPELLPPEDLVPPGDADALARKINEVLSDPARMERMSARNLEKAKEYREDLLMVRRTEYYTHLRDVTEEWLRSGVKS